MKINVSSEIIFSTARSGGNGGQNVNKVETMVEGRWQVETSALINSEQKNILLRKLAKKITAEGFLLVKSQVARTQLSNKLEVIKKLNALINQALIKQKVRVATKPSRASKEKRIESKKIDSEKKTNRQKIKTDLQVF